MTVSDRLESMRQELRRGVLAFAVLLALREEHYGYSLRRQLQEKGLDIEEGTLYPLVRRLEGYGLLESRWSEQEGRKRRYYRISEAGTAILFELQQEWSSLDSTLRILQEERR